MSIQRPTPELLQLVAKTISIPNKDKQGAKLPWNPNPQQIKSWNAGWENPWIYILKARQTGETTATCLVDLLFTLLNDLAGNAVETWLVYDKEDNSRDKVALISDWCAQLEIEHRPTELDIRFPNGSRIRGITAGGSRAGASKTVHRLHISELPNWPDASSTWTSLMSCLVEGGFVAIETTMLVGSEGGLLAKEKWEDPENAFAKVFHPVQDFDAYKFDPSDCRPDIEIESKPNNKKPLKDEVREWLEEEGFTDERSMAYMQWALQNKVKAGDKVSLLREYPQLSKHCFALAEGLWIKHEIEVVAARELVVGDQIIKILVEPEQCSGRPVMAMDTGGGLGRDANAFAVVDRTDGRILATYKDNRSTVRQMMLAAKWVQEMYTFDVEYQRGFFKQVDTYVPPLLIEDTGVGQTTPQIAEEYDLDYERFHAYDGVTYRSLQYVREAAEKGLAGPLELKLESEELVCINGRFKGSKDLMVCIGACYAWIQDNALEDIQGAAQPDTIRARFYHNMKRERAGNWPASLV